MKTTMLCGCTQHHRINNIVVQNRRAATGLSSRYPIPHRSMGRKEAFQTTRVWPLDQAWGVGVDTKTLTETLPQNLFAFSIVPYAGFLFHLTRSKQAPKLTLFGFYFLLVFVFATIPAGIYAKNVYGTTLANVDYLHGSAEFMLTLTNLFVVLGLRQAIREKERENATIDGE
ncbi:hypothetical protein PSENEW3_00005676 [Picochlorum sp. SENEW3]|nr:hypothetical protein PSENEW3_00005676 [Picochlorum sp. SENEW3]